MSLGGLQVSALAASDGMIVVGCSACNMYKGLIQVYNKTMKLVATFNGTALNQQLGSSLQALTQSSTFDSFYVGSSSSGSLSTRYYYFNLIRAVKAPNQTLALNFTVQALKNLTSPPQSGLYLGSYNNGETLLTKNGFSSAVFKT